MAFKENKTVTEVEMADNALRVLLSTMLGIEVDAEDIKGWADNDVAVDNTDRSESPVNDVKDRAVDKELVDLLNNCPAAAKVKLLIHDTLDKLLTGEVELENAAELIQVIQAVDLCKKL
jgi:hypothetical protein